MSKDFDRSILRPGDHLLYFDCRSLIDWGITIKTAQAQPHIAHIEIYEGRGMSVASRNFKGVDRYLFRYDGLVCVRRPLAILDIESATQWFETTARGQAYDLKGIACFYLAVKQGSLNKMFCSEFALRWDRSAGFEPFNPDQDADRTAPSLFWSASQFESIWQK